MFLISRQANKAVALLPNSFFHRAVSILAPRQSAIDDVLTIKVTGLTPGKEIALVAQTSRKDVTLSAFANYVADDYGNVDLTRTSALPGGSFSGVEPMGLFWSASLTSQIKIPFRMLSGNDLDSWVYDLYVLNGHHDSLDESLKSVSSNLCKTSIDRLFLPKGVKRIEVNHGKLKALLFLPEGDGKFPAVIDIFGGAHGLVAYRGGLFAKHGFACLCIAYAAYADLPKDLTSIDTDYFDLGFQYLSNHPQIHANAIGAFGSCLGGTIANALARCQPGIKAVTAVSPEVFAGTFEYKLVENGKAFTVPGCKWLTHLAKERDGAMDIQPCIRPSIKKSGGYERHLLDYGKIAAPLLFMYGSNDQFFILDFMLPILQKQFEKEKKTNVEVIVYPGAGHIIQPPYMPMFGRYHSPYFGAQIWFGGQPAPHNRAQENMWRKTLDFFRKHLK